MRKTLKLYRFSVKMNGSSNHCRDILLFFGVDLEKAFQGRRKPPKTWWDITV